jgi:hypothetical protein
MKRRILVHTGLLSGFEPTIVAIPDWPAIEKMLVIQDVVPEMRAGPNTHSSAKASATTDFPKAR